MEENQEKMHLMISSSASAETNVTIVYDTTVQKYNFSAIKTVNDAMVNQSPSLVAMQKKEPKLAANMLKLMIAKTARAFNLTRNIEPAQIECLVEDLQSEYYYLKLSEIFYVLKEARMGRMGKTYERIDQPTIMQWFENYVEQRLAIGESNYLAKHEQYTHGEKDRKYDGYISKLFTEQQKEQDKKVLNLAYGMAKKMNANNQPQTIYVQANEDTQNSDQPQKPESEA